MEVSRDSDASCEQGSQLVTPYYTPYQKQIFQKSDLEPVNMEDLSSGSGGDSSMASLEESPRSPSSPSSISELEYVITSDSYVEKQDNNMVWEEVNRSYDELLKKFIENEEELRASKFELRTSKFKLQLFEEEIVKLKIQIEKSESQLDYVRNELKLKEDDLEHEKGQVVELQKQTAELETHVPDCCYKIAKLVEQLEVANENLKISNDENERLTKELGSRSSETHQLQGQLEVAHKNVAKLEYEFDSGRKQIQGLESRITWYAANKTNLDLEVQKLKDEILHAQELFSLEKDQLQSDISSLSEMKIQLTSRLKEWESKSNALEDIIRQYEAEKLKQEELHATLQMALQEEITSLKEELGEEINVVEVMNKEVELQETQQMVLLGEITSLKKELGQERHVLQAVNKELELHVTQQMVLQGEIIYLKKELGQRRHDMEAVNKEFDKHKKEFDIHTQQLNNLKLKVEELQKEVIRQNDMISDGAKEKREAIRQLCFSLEHYRSGYQELLRAFDSHTRRRSFICWP